MKKILCLVLLVGFVYPQQTPHLTGNSFLDEYPFDKNFDEMDQLELVTFTQYCSYINGFRSGNSSTMTMLKEVKGIDSTTISSHDLVERTCGIPTGQLIRMIKKWCDDNPAKTHYNFDSILWGVILLQLPIKDCK